MSYSFKLLWLAHQPNTHRFHQNSDELNDLREQNKSKQLPKIKIKKKPNVFQYIRFKEFKICNEWCTQSILWFEFIKNGVFSLIIEVWSMGMLKYGGSNEWKSKKKGFKQRSKCSANHVSSSCGDLPYRSTPTPFEIKSLELSLQIAEVFTSKFDLKRYVFYLYLYI